jgi:membrane-associated phospholipid phosphatase
MAAEVGRDGAARAWVGRSPWSPALAATAALAGFAALLDGVRERADLAAWDPRVSAEIVALRSSTGSALAPVITRLGDLVVLAPLGVILALVLAVRRRSAGPGLVLAGAMAGGAALTFAAKVLVGRDRPPASLALGPLPTDHAFPSGHAMNSTVFLATVAWLLWPSAGPRSRGALVLGTSMAAAAVGATRLYLGYHWLTDVLAGWALAAAWLCLLLCLRRVRAINTAG